VRGWKRRSPQGILRRVRRSALVLGLLALAACAAKSSVRPDAAFTPDLELTRAPYDDVHADWKERLAQPYVYLEHLGSYAETGRLLAGLHAALAAAGLEPAGPPFGLYYDDPGRVPVARLRSRACFPVAAAPAPASDLRADVLPAATVAYALVAGPYPEVPRAHAGLFAFIARMGWVEDGPVREIYITPPQSVESYADLVTEVQVPVRSAR
jgi:effector-binding domain-containing protein